jgi:transposase
MKRKSHTKQFKAKVALEAIRGDKTIQELSQQYEVHPGQITTWKKQLTQGAEGLFERPNKKKKDLSDEELKETELYKNIGKLQVENQFLKKKYKELFGREPDL